MQQDMRNAAASPEASVAAHDEELASAPASAEVKEGGAVEGAVEDKAKGPDPTPNGAAPTGPPSKRSASPLGPALKKVLGRRADKASVLKDSTVTIKCAKVSPHKSAIWDSTLGYPGEGPGTPSALITATQNMNGSLTSNTWNLLLKEAKRLQR